MTRDLNGLAKEIVFGRRLGRDDDLSFLLETDLNPLCEAADYIRAKLVGNRVDLCAIVNARSGACSEDCKYCAQSSRRKGDCEVYPFLPEETIVARCEESEREGVDRFAIVTSGRRLDGEEFERALRAVAAMRDRRKVGLCASLGLLSKEQFRRLRAAGVSRYHCNIETSRRFFPSICTTHAFDQKLETLRAAREAGLEICSGGIVGMGETWEDRVDMASTLSELRVDSIPINVLTPIKGTPLENEPRLTENEILRIVAIFRFLNPTADVRFAAGRGLLANLGERAFLSGASAAITGNMLTTVACATIRDDREMLTNLGRTVSPLPKE